MRKALKIAKSAVSTAWKLSDGKKTNLSVILILLNKAVQVFFPAFMTPEQHQFVEDTAMALGSLGLTHKAAKNRDKIGAAIKKAVGVNKQK